MIADESFHAAQMFAQVARDIADHDDLSGTRGHIVRVAKTALDTAGAAMWHLRDPTKMALDACTDPVFIDLMLDIVRDNPDGPAWAALKDQQPHVSQDLTVETRWPYYVSRLRSESPVRSIMGYPLTVGKNELGVLALYSHEVGHFTPEVQDRAAVLAAHAALALERASVVEHNDHLQQALASNRRIGMAIGILMAGLRVTDQQAFDLLRLTSQNTHTKLRDVAEDVILTGTVPEWRRKTQPRTA